MKTDFLSVSMPDLFLCLATDESLTKQYPNLSVLAKIVLVFPASSVDCERGFSTLNLIKTKTRNRLNTLHLDMLQRIKLLGGPPEKFPFAKAHQLWLHSKKRRTKLAIPDECEDDSEISDLEFYDTDDDMELDM